MNGEKKWNALAILNVLMTADDYLTTDEIVERVGCCRKTVYNAADFLEVNGFAIDVIPGKGGYNGDKNKYKYIGLRGL